MGLDYVEIEERGAFSPHTFRRLQRLSRARKTDIVHSHDYKTDLLALMLARVEGVIPLATVHGWTGTTKRETLYYALDKRILAAFPRLIAVSTEIRNELISAGARPKRICTIRNGIDSRSFRRNPGREPVVRKSLGFGHKEFVIGAVGRLEPQKRFDILLDAFAQVRRHRPEVRLIVAGAGSRLHQLEELARHNGIGCDCQFLGHRPDIADLHHAFDLFVQSAEYEGTPNAVLEAMALETPVVATAVGGTAELLDHEVHALLSPPHNADALSRAIERAVQDQAGAKRRSRAARLRVEQELSFAARARRVEAIYEKLMTGRMRKGWGRRRS
jgi:glycosyltransferase involved in cell wall biosynthesis